MTQAFDEPLVCTDSVYLVIHKFARLGSADCEVTADMAPCKVVKMGQMDTYGKSGTPEELKKKYGMTKDYIIDAVKRVLN